MATNKNAKSPPRSLEIEALKATTEALKATAEALKEAALALKEVAAALKEAGAISRPDTPEATLESTLEAAESYSCSRSGLQQLKDDQIRNGKVGIDHVKERTRHMLRCEHTITISRDDQKIPLSKGLLSDLADPISSFWFDDVHCFPDPKTLGESAYFDVFTNVVHQACRDKS